MSELKRRPFCGGEASERDFTEPFKNGWVGCQKCHCFIEWVKEGKSMAIAAWNRRAPVAGNPATENELVNNSYKLENKPLTLEELRGMEGEPVWIETPNKSKSEWVFVKQVKENGDIRVRPDFHSCINLPYSKVKFYRQKPEAEEEAE